MFRFGVHSGNPDDSYLRLMHIVLSGGKAAVAYDGGIVDAAMHVYLDTSGSSRAPPRSGSEAAP
jgi:hypothetical protein